MFWEVREGDTSFSGRYELGTMRSLGGGGERSNPIRNRVKICGKVFIPEKLFFYAPYDHGYDVFSF